MPGQDNADRRSRSDGSRRLWLLAMAALIVAGGAVPYGLMAGPGAGLTVAVFWTAFGLAVIAMIAAATLRWKD